MKIEIIPFQHEASKKIYTDYLNSVNKATKSLSKQNQEDICMEINSHIFESMQKNKADKELDVLINVLEKLGSPEEVLKPLVADKKLEQATISLNPFHLFKALFINITNGFAYFIFFIMYLVLLGFLFLIFAKIFNPSQVGMFFKSDSYWILGITDYPNSQELLGNWFIPFMIILTLLLYVVLIHLIKLKKRIKTYSILSGK